MCVGVFQRMSTHYVHTQKQKRVLGPWDKSYRSCELPCACKELDLDPSEAQPVLLATEPAPAGMVLRGIHI